MRLNRIVLTDTLVGDHYVVEETHGPYIRVTSSQENHVEDGLKFWWQKTSPEEIKSVSKETADKGTILHGYFVGFLKGEVVDVQEEWAKKPCENVQKFILEHKVKPIHMEKKYVSNDLGLGGTVDFIGTYDGKPMILDWKTGGVYLSYAVQLAIYMAIHYENTKEFIPDLAVVQVHRDGEEVEFHPIQKPLAALRAGLCTFERWKFDNAKKLDWIKAPEEVLEARAKTKMAKRVAFEEANWRPEYQWPWVNKDSLVWFNEFINKLEGDN